MTTSFIH